MAWKHDGLRQARNVRLEFSPLPTSWMPSSNPFGLRLQATCSAAWHGAAAANPSASPTTPCAARTINDIFPSPMNDFSLTFYGGSATPEPATWALMLVGVGALGAALRMAARKNAMALTAA